MGDNFSFYLEKENTMFGGKVLAVCYKATPEEMEKYNLTSNNIILFVKSKKIDEIREGQGFDYFDKFATLLDDDVLLRVQCECFLGMYGDSHCDCEEQRMNAIKLISNECGILMHMPQEAQGWGLHYKLRELELQVSGRDINGEYVGTKTRDEAQKHLMGTQQFRDNRSYEIIYHIFKQLNIQSKMFVLITDSNRKIRAMSDMGLNVQKYAEYREQQVNPENLSEYLVKILNLTHEFDDKTIKKIIEIISSRKYNGRSLSTFLEIIDRIKKDKDYQLSDEYKNMFLELYNSIICGEEKQYIFGDENRVKVQNSFACKVDASIFKVLTLIYGTGIFDRISFETMHYFRNKNDGTSVRIRVSRVLDAVEDKCKLFVGQTYGVLSLYDEKTKKVIEHEATTSTLNSYFENPDYEYRKSTEMVTTISEDILDGISIYIKKVPNASRRIINIFGKSDKIREVMDRIMQVNSSALFNTVNDTKLSEQDFSEYNLRFADQSSTISEEVAIFRLTKASEPVVQEVYRKVIPYGV